MAIRVTAVAVDRIVVAAVLSVLICVVVSVGASAHPGHVHGDGRIPGQPDFQRVGRVVIRFHVDRAAYSYERPDGPPLWFHRDEAPALVGGHLALPTEQEGVVCATSGHRIRIMYAGPTSATLTPEEASAIRNYVQRMNWKVLSESVRSSGNTRALKMRVDCTPGGTINIWSFVSAFASPSQVWGRAEDVYGYPTGADSVKNLIFVDADDPSGDAAGYGQMANDSIKSDSDSANGSRSRTSSAVVYKGDLGDYWSDHTTLHELFHAMGAVNSRAPYGTDGNHCTDGIDVMCYADGSGPIWDPPVYSETRCPASSGFYSPIEVPLDCGYDSYFDAAEESGEWLNTHWNLGGAENPFLVQAPAPRAPVLTMRAASLSSSNAAILRAAINPNGLVTQYRFEYGPTTAYGTSLPLPDGKISSHLYTDHEISQATYTNLQPGTTYHFRLVASNALGTTYGPDQTFTATWRLQATGNVTGASGSYLHAVGCEPASTALCTAVGRSTSVGADSPIAQRWDGSSWSSQAPALKSGATHTRLFGVDCPSATRCIAVGNAQVSGSGAAPLAQLWNNDRWSIQVTPVPSGSTDSELVDVGCNSTANCVGVGSAEIGGVRTAIAERWTSPDWALDSVPIPAGATSSQLDGVDCLWSNYCVAVGRYTTSSGAVRSLAMFWDGTAWALRTLTEPGAASQSVLLDVSCTPSPNACMAVGAWKNVNDGNKQFTLAYRLSGSSTWALQSTPNPAGSIATVLQDVSCATATSCTAVGSWVANASGPNLTLAEHWDAGAWTLQGTIDPAGATFSAFFGASCRGTGCIGVGWSTDGAGAARTLGEIRE